MQNVQVEPFQLIGITIRTSNANGQAAKEIGELWGRFMAEGIPAKIPNKVDNTVYSLYTDYEGDHTLPYTVLLGCPVSSIEDVPAGMEGRSFAGGEYRHFSAKGDLLKGIVVEQWQKIWAMDLDRAYTADFEIFGEKAQDPANAEVEFFVATK